ncbi:MAG: putative glycosyltransferase [Anaerolineaceae bacterium]|nr:MAG: putative glycosyltransferase [Anaerolineaceae bacterium]
MPRIGMNPNRDHKTDYHPARVTLAMLTCLPEEAGYFEHRFDSMRVSLESLIANTPQPYDLLVFDNGSCPRWVDYLRGLRGAGKIQYLLLSSRNIGKLGALKIIFNAAPGEIVAYTDDDVFFLPGWLDEHLKIIDTYPNVGSVCGLYMRPLMAYGIKSTMKFIKRRDVKVERGMLLPREMEQHYIDHMGRTWESYQKETDGLEDIAVTFNGVQAFVSAGHHQFVAPRHVILEALPKVWGGELMGKMRDLDNEVDRLGCLRFCTRTFLTRLTGNALDAETAALAREYGIEATAPITRLPGRLSNRILRWKVIRELAHRIYNALFRIISNQG